MWATIAKYLVQAAVWCLNNPTAVDAGVKEAHAIVDALHQAKTAK